jgi:alpha-glucosidase
MEDGAAFFLPGDLPAEKVERSFTLLAEPVALGPLPEGWRVVPEFSASEGRRRVTIPLTGGEIPYGTGLVAGRLMRGATRVTLWNTDNYAYGTDEARRLYESHPWVLAVRRDGTAFGVLADTTWKTELRLSWEITFTSDGPAFRVIVIERESPQEVLEALADLTGHMSLPPRWALGYQQSRYSYAPAQEALQIAKEFRERKIPCDVLWLDIDYMDGYRVFTFDPAGFPDPKGLNDALHALDFHTVWMIDPGVKAEAGYSVYDSGTAADAWVREASGGVYRGKVWPGECVFPDFTQPQVRTWWAGLYRDFLATGIDGVWNDMNEPAVFEVDSKTMPEDNRHLGGGEIAPGPHARYHNVYGMLMVRATREGILAARPERRPFVLSRANFLGGQRYAATWTGDNVSSREHLLWSVPMTLNLGLSGQPLSGPDLGGYVGDATAELWMDWISSGAFFPFCRGHAGKEANRKEPWAFGEEAEAVSRTALQRRYRLLPYLYTVFRESSVTGLPVMRPVFFADVRDLRLRAEDQAFLVGADLLVVPHWAKAPQIPEGWPAISLLGEDAQNDPHQATLRLRPGAILPLGKVVQSTNEESLAPLTLLVAPDADVRATGSLYEDAGDGFGYRDGDYLLTTYEAAPVEGGIRISVRSVEGRRARPERELIVQVVDNGKILGEARGRDGEPLFVPIHGNGR